jgi:AcrR family transcriptional regulator
MRWSKGDGERGYHHGNLREELVRAALALIAEKGPAGFTFAEAARWAGVSPAAPYRHFPRSRRTHGRRGPSRLRGPRKGAD